VVSHLFSGGVECPAIEDLFGSETPQYFARSPDDERFSNRVAHTVNIVFSQPADGSVRRDLSLTDAGLALLFRNGRLFSIGEGDLRGAVWSGGNRHCVTTLGNPRIWENGAEEQRNKDSTRLDHRNGTQRPILPALSCSAFKLIPASPPPSNRAPTSPTLLSSHIHTAPRKFSRPHAVPPPYPPANRPRTSNPPAARQAQPSLSILRRARVTGEAIGTLHVVEVLDQSELLQNCARSG